MLLNLFAQTYDFTTTTTGDPDTGVVGGLLFWLIYFIFLIVYIIGMWKVYTKAGKPGWASIIPFYNIWVLLQIAGRPVWWIILFFIPLVNIAVGIILGVDIAKKFGYGPIFGAIVCGLLSIGYLIIGFSKAKYDPSVEPAATTTPTAPQSPATT